jgi:DNA-binding SARP family transcriptional activator
MQNPGSPTGATRGNGRARNHESRGVRNDVRSMVSARREPSPDDSRAAGHLGLSLLGGFRVMLDGGHLDVPMASQRIVALLALHDEPLRRTYVAGTLWPEYLDGRAAANLRTALSRLPVGPGVLVTAHGQLLALSARIDVDLRETRRLIRQVLDRGEEALHLDQVRDRLMVDLLPGWYDDWLVYEQERYREIRLQALEALCRWLVDQGRNGTAVEVGLATVATDPLRESAQRVLLEAHLAAGNPAAAVRGFERYRSLLRRELGMEPSGALAEMVSRGGR